MYKKTVLDNGVRLVTNSMKDKKSLAVGIWINAGSRFEDPRFSGISHFLEHLVFKGTRKYSCQQIKETIEGVGGSFNGFTSEEATCYLVKIPAKYQHVAIDILSEMVIYPEIPGNELERERTVILEEIKMYKDLPQSYVYELLDKLMWPGQPLGMSILGTTESITGMKRSDLRSYKEQYYTGSNIVVAAAGALDHAGLVSLLNKKFKNVEKSKRNVFSGVLEKQDNPQMDLLGKDTEQTHLAIGFHSIAREHPLKYALSLLHIILGANSSSRLFSEIREKRGMAYEIGTVVKRLRDTGAFVIHAGVDNSKVEEAIKLIFQQIQKIKDKQVNRDELKRAKEFYMGQLMIALEDTLDHMLWLGEPMITSDTTRTLDGVIREVRKVTAEDILKVSNMVFSNSGINAAVIGPQERKRQNINNALQLV